MCLKVTPSKMMMDTSKLGCLRSQLLSALLLLLALNVERSSSSSCVSPPNPVRNGQVDIIGHPKTLASYPENTQAKVLCNPGFKLANWNLKVRVCSGRSWTNNPAGDAVCIADGNICGPPPPIAHGRYVVADGSTSEHGEQGSELESYAGGTKMAPMCEPGYTINCSTYPCGHVRCQDRPGKWTPVDGEFITKCTPSGGYVSPSVGGGSSAGGGSSSSIDHHQSSSHDTGHHKEVSSYLMLTVGLIFLLAVGSIILFALRRPIFCKKSSREMGDGGEHGGGHCHYGGGSSTSATGPPQLDSLPVAMNTGIFLPGVGYDLQDCNFQDIPIVGTTVFK